MRQLVHISFCDKMLLLSMLIVLICTTEDAPVTLVHKSDQILLEFCIGRMGCEIVHGIIH